MLYSPFPYLLILVLVVSAAAAQFSGLLSTVHILLRLEPSARSTEAFSLALAYLAGSDFMACLLLLQRCAPTSARPPVTVHHTHTHPMYTGNSRPSSRWASARHSGPVSPTRPRRLVRGEPSILYYAILQCPPVLCFRLVLVLCSPRVCDTVAGTGTSTSSMSCPPRPPCSTCTRTRSEGE